MSECAWTPELETQLDAAGKVAALPKPEREKVTSELGALAAKLDGAGQPEAARILASIAVLGEGAEDSMYAARRLLSAQ